MKLITYFKNQFPLGSVEETADAQFCVKKKKYVNFDLNIGWSLRTQNIKNRKNNRRVYTKECWGSVYCENKNCQFFDIDTRPASNKTLIEKQCRLICENPVIRRECKIKVTFEFKGNKCTMKHAGDHSHKEYLPIYLTIEEKEELNTVVKSDPLITLKAAVVSVSVKTEKIIEPFNNSVSKILSNKD